MQNVRLVDEPDVYLRNSGRAFLVSAETFDEEIAKLGLRPIVPTETVRRETDQGGLRVAANAFYRKGA